MMGKNDFNEFAVPLYTERLEMEECQGLFETQINHD